MFATMVPAACPELAGNYRGSSSSHLQNYSVEVRGDDMVGTPPGMVALHMKLFEEHFAERL